VIPSNSKHSWFILARLWNWQFLHWKCTTHRSSTLLSGFSWLQFGQVMTQTLWLFIVRG